MQSLWIYGCWKHFGKHTSSERGSERIGRNVCEQVSDQSIWSVTLSLVHVVWIFRGVGFEVHVQGDRHSQANLRAVHHTQETFCWTISSPLSLTVTRHNQRYHCSWQLSEKKNQTTGGTPGRLRPQEARKVEQVLKGMEQKVWGGKGIMD